LYEIRLILISIGNCCSEKTCGNMSSLISGTKSSALKNNTLEPNPSYGVLPDALHSVHKSIVDETDQVVYDNDQIPEYDDTETYVNDQLLGTEEELYANDEPDVFEEYEYIHVQHSPRTSPRTLPEMLESNEYY